MSKIYLVILALFGLCHGDDSIQKESRIIGGFPAGPGAAPYQASLRSILNNRQHFCGGTILSSRTILTAAQCVYNIPDYDIVVSVGSNKLSTGGYRYHCNGILTHPNFNIETLANDIALVYVDLNIHMTDDVQPWRIGSLDLIPGTKVVLSGWGTIDSTGTKPNDLQMISLLTIGIEDCQEKLADVGKVTDNQMCTFTTMGEGSCAGDAGGPLVYGGQVVGVASWGYPCAIGYPDVFTKVTAYYEWILQHLK